MTSDPGASGALFHDGDLVCMCHASAAALHCSPLFIVRSVLITTNLERFFQPDYVDIVLFTQVTSVFLETDEWSSPQEDLFQQPGLRSEFEQIRDCLDKGMHDTLCIL